ncbi:uncharacterized protein il2 [Epinephelus lanceolatus]
MEHFIRIAFWIVSLSGCLQTESQPIPDARSDFHIDSMLKNVNCSSGSTFYTPTNVQRECFTKALECVKKELYGTAKAECEDPYNYISAALEQLHELTEELGKKGNAPTSSTKCDCELWSETPFSEFLNKTENLLQAVNTAQEENN